MIGSIRIQKESLILTKNKTTGGTWSLRYYEEVQGERVYRKRRIGTEREFPPRRDAERTVLALRANINSEVRSPETVEELIAHCLKHELTTERKAFSTVEVNSTFIKGYIKPKWGSVQLSDVRTVVVETWLDAIFPVAPARIKAGRMIRFNIMSGPSGCFPFFLNEGNTKSLFPR